MSEQKEMSDQEWLEHIRKRPKFCSVESPFGILTWLEGDDPFLPGVLEEWESERLRKENGK